MVSRRCLLALASVVLAAMLGGCTDPPPQEDPFASAEGRACQAVEYDAVANALGVRFDTAAAAKVDETYSCALGIDHQDFPDLVVTLSPTAADPVIYRATSIPSGFTALKQLGREAYRLDLPRGTYSGRDASPSGPAVQLGWLSAAPQMMTLRYTFPADATDADVAALTPRLVAFAKAIEDEIVNHPLG
ncbi:MAG TPA: hypothetical protein VH561_04845 [Micromonosporaceae bacterium]